jgi:iron complex transport system ATP-binding protein
VRYQVEILDLVRDLVDRHGLTVVLVLHDLNQAAAYADRMVLLRDGRIVGEGTPSQVLTREAVATVFGLDVDVEPDPVTGTPTCQFYRRRVPACG